MPEEPAFEGPQELLVGEEVDVLVDPLAGGDREVVGERVVRRFEGVAHLVALEDEVVGLRPRNGSIARVDRPADRPDRSGSSLDPDHDLVAGPVLADCMDDPFGEAR